MARLYPFAERDEAEHRGKGGQSKNHHSNGQHVDSPRRYQVPVLLPITQMPMSAVFWCRRASAEAR